jgi:hypothetical protein
MTRQPLWQYYISVILVMAPAVRILTRAGFKPYPALLLLAPQVGYILCAAYLTFTKWPKLPAKEAKP